MPVVRACAQTGQGLPQLQERHRGAGWESASSWTEDAWVKGVASHQTWLTKERKKGSGMRWECERLNGGVYHNLYAQNTSHPLHPNPTSCTLIPPHPSPASAASPCLPAGPPVPPSLPASLIGPPWLPPCRPSPSPPSLLARPQGLSVAPACRTGWRGMLAWAACTGLVHLPLQILTPITFPAQYEFGRPKR